MQTVKWVLNFFLLSIFPKTELQRTDEIWVSELRNAPLLWVAFSKCHWGGWDEINTAMQRTSKEQKSAKMVKEFYCYCLSYNTDCHNGFSWVNWTTSMKRKACERYAGISLPQSTRLSSHSKKWEILRRSSYTFCCSRIPLCYSWIWLVVNISIIGICKN